MSRLVGRVRAVGRWRALAALVVCAIVALVGGELFARYGLGLGDPPLLMGDAELEYVPIPGTYRRLGNLVVINRWHMRSEEVSREKSDPAEFRVLMVGDSIIEGGTLIDQRDVAATVLERSLGGALRAPVRVMNVAVGSWGPENQLAYVRRYGVFDADVVVWVLSSGDGFDLIDRERSSDWRQTRPRSALLELWTRYRRGALGYLRYYVTGVEAGREKAAPPEFLLREAEEGALRAMEAFVEEIRRSGARLVVLMHPSVAELDGELVPAAVATRERLVSIGVTPIMGAAVYAEKIDSPRKMYRDLEHLNVHGHGVMAEVLHRVVMDAMRARETGAGSADSPD